MSPYIVRGVLSRMMQLIAEEIWGALKEVENFSHAGSLHVRLTQVVSDTHFSQVGLSLECIYIIVL